jgi:2-polyprenyl-3-methyl-5-hydroxy-6-metoxy-1,4-benzoquinol methylase
MDETVWKERMGNLFARRAKGEFTKNSLVSDYAKHLSKFKIGYTVLDVGCGNMVVKDLLPAGRLYTGIDAFPCSPTVREMRIEDLPRDEMYQTVLCFAVLDGVLDLDITLEVINHVATKNVCMLTGLDIKPDQYHTHEITLYKLIKGLIDFDLTFSEELSPKVWLLEFTRK